MRALSLIRDGLAFSFLLAVLFMAFIAAGM